MLKGNSTIIREACVDTAENAFRAEKEGASRIELCSRLDLDGLTPGRELMEEVCSKIQIPVHAMVRPRAGNFVYSDNELEQMKDHIDLCRDCGAAGVVLGVLNDQSEIDIKATAMLAAYASPLKVVFHKAIDSTPDPVKAAQQLASIKQMTGILTSGGQATAEQGTSVLEKMIRQVGDRLEIIVAGKVTRHNLGSLHGKLNSTAYHGKLIVYDA